MTFPMLFFYSNFLVSKLGNGVKSLKNKKFITSNSNKIHRIGANNYRYVFKFTNTVILVYLKLLNSSKYDR